MPTPMTLFFSLLESFSFQPLFVSLNFFPPTISVRCCSLATLLYNVLLPLSLSLVINIPRRVPETPLKEKKKSVVLQQDLCVLVCHFDHILDEINLRGESASGSGRYFYLPTFITCGASDDGQESCQAGRPLTERDRC